MLVVKGGHKCMRLSTHRVVDGSDVRVYNMSLATHPKCHVYLIRIKDPVTMEQMGLPFVLQVHTGHTHRHTHAHIYPCRLPALSLSLSLSVSQWAV